MKWLYRIIARLKGCRHRWEKVDALTPMRWSVHLLCKFESGVGLRCKRCGDVKFVEVKP